MLYLKIFLMVLAGLAVALIVCDLFVKWTIAHELEGDFIDDDGFEN